MPSATNGAGQSGWAEMPLHRGKVSFQLAGRPRKMARGKIAVPPVMFCPHKPPSAAGHGQLPHSRRLQIVTGPELRPLVMKSAIIWSKWCMTCPHCFPTIPSIVSNPASCSRHCASCLEPHHFPQGHQPRADVYARSCWLCLSNPDVYRPNLEASLDFKISMGSWRKPWALPCNQITCEVLLLGRHDSPATARKEPVETCQHIQGDSLVNPWPPSATEKHTPWQNFGSPHTLLEKFRIFFGLSQIHPLRRNHRLTLGFSISCPSSAQGQCRICRVENATGWEVNQMPAEEPCQKNLLNGRPQHHSPKLGSLSRWSSHRGTRRSRPWWTGTSRWSGTSSKVSWGQCFTEDHDLEMVENKTNRQLDDWCSNLAFDLKGFRQWFQALKFCWERTPKKVAALSGNQTEHQHNIWQSLFVAWYSAKSASGKSHFNVRSVLFSTSHSLSLATFSGLKG